MPPLPFAPLRARLAVACCAALLAVAGCGGDGGSDESATLRETSPDELVAPRGGTGDTTPLTADEGAGTVSGGSAPRGAGNFRAPEGADAPGSPRVRPSKGLQLESVAGEQPHWIVRAKREDRDFCLTVIIPGPFDPGPLCQTGELLALQFFGDDASGPAIGTVTQAPLTRREAPSQMVVAGLISGDVKRVRVRYGTKLIDAKLTDAVVDLSVNQSLARELSGATRKQIARLPDPVTVRAFAVHFPRDAGNPPRVVTPETPRPIDGVITLQLS